MDEITTDNHGLSEAEEALLEAALEQAHEDDNREILPLNSESLLIDESSSRFSSAIWFSKIGEQTVTLAGLGGIGSYVAFLLGRLKVSRLVIYDDDIVDETNLSGQLFASQDVGNAKTSGMCRILREFSQYHSVMSRQERYGTSSPTTDIMICGFDNMMARQTFYSKWKLHVMGLSEEDRAKCLFIDGRLAAEEFQVFCIKGSDTYLMQKYENEWLFDDNEAEATLCSYKQTSFCANMIASVMVNLFVNFIANQCEPLIERELPFYTNYDAERMYFKTQMV